MFQVRDCHVHTAMTDERQKVRQRVRLAPCNEYCEASAEMRKRKVYGLTDFLVKLLAYKDADVEKADPVKAAEVFGISVDHAAGYIRMEKEKRGLAHG